MKKMNLLAGGLLAVGCAVAAQPENLARGKTYAFSRPPNYALCKDAGDAVQLTDGEWQRTTGGTFWTNKGTVGWGMSSGGEAVVTVDLGKDEPLCGFSWNFAAGRAGVNWPDLLFVYVSTDGKTWRFAGDLFAAAAAEGRAPSKDGYAVHRAWATNLPCHGRYVAFLVRASGYAFVDEVEVYRGPAANLTETGEEETAASPVAHYAAYRAHQNFFRDAAKVGRAAQGLPSAAREELTRDLQRMNARIARARGFAQPFFWACDRWANNDLLDLPPAKTAVAAPLEVEMMRGETRGTAVNLTNPTENEIETTVSAQGFPAAAKVELREVVSTLVKAGTRVSGLLLPNAAGPDVKVKIPAGTTKQIWISFAKPALAAGRYAGRIAAAGTEAPLALRVADLDFPARPRMHVGGWDYVERGNRFYGAPGNLAAKMARMREIFTDSPWAGSGVMPSGAKFDAAGALVNRAQLDFTAWNDWVALWGDQARQYCVFMSVGRQFRGEKMGTARFNRMVGEYMRAWYDGARAKLAGRRIVILLVDEPREAEMDERVVTWAKAVKAAAPEFVVFEDVDYSDPTRASAELFAASDVICPPCPTMTARHSEDFYARKGREGKELWLYSCCGPSRTFDPIAYYRAQPWHAWKIGAKGTFFWALGCGGGIGDSFRPFEQPGTEYSPFFVSPTDAFRAKQSEAILESVEDYEYLALLAEKIAAQKKAGCDVAALEKLLREAPARAIPEEAWLKNNEYSFSLGAKRYDWSLPRDHAAMDAVRVELLHALEAPAAAGARLAAANAEVAVAPDAPAATRYAAEQLTHFLSQALGGAVACVTAPTAGKYTIYLGTNAWSRAAGLKPETLGRDAFAISIAADRAFIAGCDDPKIDPRRVIACGGSTLFERATLFGVYDFLERYAGCRFYFPGELGTVVPRAAALTLAVGERTVAPKMMKRDCYIQGAGPYPAIDPKNASAQASAKTAYRLFLRETTEDIVCCHGQNRFRIAERFSDTHPEYFQLRRDGTRCTGTNETSCSSRQLCHTSPVWDVFRDESVARVRKGEKYVDVMPQDGMSPCMCEKCQKTFNTTDFSLASGYASELIWSNTVKVAQAITAAGLEGGVSQMAYGTYRRIPSVEIPSNVKVVLAVGGPWALSRPDICEKQYDFVRVWSEKLHGKVAWIWTYPMKNYGRLQAKGVPQVAPRAYAAFYNRVLPWIDGSFVESNVGETLVQNYLNFYVFSRIAWYGTTDVDALLAEHHRLMFGRGAAAMAKFFDRVEEKWIREIAVPSLIGETEIGPMIYPPTEAEIWAKVCTPQYVAELDGYLKAAAAATAPGSLENRRVAWIRAELFDRLAAGSFDFAARHAQVENFVVKVGRDADGVIVIDRVAGRKGGGKAPVSARAKIWKTGTSLEVRVDCEEPDMANVVAKPRRHDDHETWMDNGIEFFISPDMDRHHMYQFVMTSAGVLFDNEVARNNGKGLAWESGATVKATPHAGGYRIEASIPLKALPGLGRRALVNFGRDRVRATGTERYVWDTLAKDYQDLDSFATVEFNE